MKDYLKSQIEKVSDVNLARCITREYLQARFLESMQNCGAFVNWAFVGGTALRFLYLMPRFSEDLDFSILKPGIEDRFAEYIKKAKAIFGAENYSLSIKAKTTKTVKSAFVKFDGLLFELGLSPHVSEVISIKIEIDTDPPAGLRAGEDGDRGDPRDRARRFAAQVLFQTRVEPHPASVAEVVVGSQELVAAEEPTAGAGMAPQYCLHPS